MLSRLRAGSAASFRPFDWDAFDGSLAPHDDVIEPAALVILEGVYAARPELRDLVDLRVLLTAADEERERRLRTRDGTPDAWALAWREAEAWYFTHVAPEESFDVIVTESVPNT